jgi:hypothetical protein
MKEFVTITFSNKLNVMKPCLSPNHSSDEIKRLGNESYSSQKTIFLVVKHASTYEQSHTYDIANKYSVHSRNCSTSHLRYQQMAKLKRLHDYKLISSWQISCLRSEMISMEHAN